MSTVSNFYLRYYVGHKGKFGHEFLEFEFRPEGLSFVKYIYMLIDEWLDNQDDSWLFLFIILLI